MKNKLKFVPFIILILIANISSAVFADPIIPHAEPQAFIIDLLVDIFVLIITLWALNVLKEFNIKKLLLYILIVYVNGMLCDIVSVILSMGFSIAFERLVNPSSDIILGMGLFLLLIVISFVTLCLSNYYIAKKIINKSKITHIIIGISIAIFTHPIIGLLFMSDIDSINLYANLFGIQ